MKLQNLLLIGIFGFSVITRAPAQTLSNEAEQKAREMLREFIQQRERPPAAVPAPAQVPAPAYTPPPVPAPAHATAPAPTAKPERVELAPAGSRKAAGTLSYPEVEQQYLAGKITARQFQKYLKDRTLEAVSSPSTVSANVQGQAVDVLRQANVSTNVNAPLIISGRPPASAATVTPPTTPAVTPDKIEGSPEQSTLSEVESKMDELLRLKAQREQLAALRNAPPAKNAAQATAPKSKRERLDELLKLYVNGKMSDSEYKEAREKLLAEPEGKN